MKLLSAFLAVTLAMPAHAASGYGVTILETPGGSAMDGYGLNNRGDVVGGVNGGAAYQAYLRSANGVYQALGGLGGPRASASAISDNGTIAGQGRTGLGVLTSIPFVRSGDGPLAPIQLPAGGQRGSSTGVNDAGTVVGYYMDPNGTTRGFRWSETSGFRTLEPNEGQANTLLYGVNAQGEAVGFSDAGALVWKADGSMMLLDAGAVGPGLATTTMAAYGINDAGQTVGQIGHDFEDGTYASRAAVWAADGSLLRTASLAGWTGLSASSINESGDVVGSAARRKFYADGSNLGDEFTAVVWRAGGDVVTLNSLIDMPSIDLRQAVSINDRGQILATGYRNDIRIDVLLTPIGGSVPEPASWAMMIMGFAAAGSAMRRRDRSAIVA